MNDHLVQTIVECDPGSTFFRFNEGLWNNILIIR